MLKSHQNVHVVVLDRNHPLDDARICRQIHTAKEQEFKVSRVHLPNLSNYETSSILFEDVKTYIYGIRKGRNTRLLRIIALMILHLFNKNIIDRCISELNINKEDIVVIHVHETELLLFASAFKRGFPISYVIYDRHEVVEAFHSYYLLAIENMCKKMIDGLVVTCPEYCALSVTYNNIPTVCVPNYPLASEYYFEDSKKLHAPQNEVLRFIYIGTQAPSIYDLELILSIAESLLSKRKDVEFIIGGGTQNSELLAKYRELESKYPSSFKYIGQISKKEAIMYTQVATFGFQLLCPASSYYVPTSSNKIYDYVQCLTIPIVRAVCPDADLLSEGGLFFDKDISNEEIISSIEEICDDRELIASKREYLETIKSKFTFENVMDNYMYLYESILSREVR